MQAMATATRDLGVGLAAFGGTNTYGPGGLAGTPLERRLPIDMRVANPAGKAAGGGHAGPRVRGKPRRGPGPARRRQAARGQPVAAGPGRGGQR